MQQIADPNVLVGFSGKDDAAVYQIRDDLLLIMTMDFFPPLVDNPYDYGRIAAANAISDIYAMGGKPLMALNILTFPSCLDTRAVKEILRGGNEVALAANLNILGGHSIDDEEPKYGLAVLGICHPDELLTNAGAKTGDVLVLTKKLGTGIMATARKGQLIGDEEMTEVVESMASLNRQALEIARNFDLHAATDVTGFGLLGHGLELAEASGRSIAIDADKLPIFSRVPEFARDGLVPGGAYRNREFAGDKLKAEEAVAEWQLDLLADPQTSGGLLLAVAEADVPELLAAFAKEQQFAVEIGEVLDASGEPKLIFRG